MSSDKLVAAKLIWLLGLMSSDILVAVNLKFFIMNHIQLSATFFPKPFGLLEIVFLEI